MATEQRATQISKVRIENFKASKFPKRDNARHHRAAGVTMASKVARFRRLRVHGIVICALK